MIKIPPKPKEVQQLEEKLAHFGFAAVYFAQEPKKFSRFDQMEVDTLPLLWLTTSSEHYSPGWRFIETVRPPTTYQSMIKWHILGDEQGVEEADRRRSEFLEYIEDEHGTKSLAVRPYQDDPFFAVLQKVRPHYSANGAHGIHAGSRGMYLPHAIQDYIIPPIAATLGISTQKMRFPYAQEFLQCLQPSMPLEWWPSYYVSEWLADFKVRPSHAAGAEHHWHSIIHSIFSVSRKEHELRVSEQLIHNHDTGSDRFNPACGFRLVIEP